MFLLHVALCVGAFISIFMCMSARVRLCFLMVFAKRRRKKFAVLSKLLTLPKPSPFARLLLFTDYLNRISYAVYDIHLLSIHVSYLTITDTFLDR